MSIEGLDYMSPITSSSKLSEFYNNGIRFICRYYCSSGNAKLLTKAEAQDISKAGMYVVPVLEQSSNYAGYFTYSTGYNDCNTAIDCAINAGQPANTVIYFAVDCDMQNNLSSVYDYFHGVSDAMNDYYHQNNSKWYVGIYGGNAEVNYMYNKWGVYYLWETAAFGGTEYSSDSIYQYKISTSANKVYFCNVEVDRDRCDKTDVTSTGGFKL